MRMGRDSPGVTSGRSLASPTRRSTDVTGRARRAGREESMSSIDKQDNGRWKARYRDANGRSRSQTFRRREDARQFLERTGTAIQRGEWRDPQAQRMTFGEWAESWWSTVGGLRPQTRTS